MAAEQADESLTELHVQVKFSGIQPQDLDATGKVLQIGKLKVPISRFGTWVFHIIQDQDEVDKLLESGIPAVLFVWALYKAYPEVLAWVSDPKDCSFILDVGKNEKKMILAEIVGKMKTEVQKFISEKKEKNLKIILIRILPEKSGQTSQTTETKSNSNKKKKQKSDKANGNLATGGGAWRLIKLRSEIDTLTGDKKARLAKIVEFCDVACEVLRFAEAEEFLPELKQLISSVRIPDDQIREVLQDMRKLQQSFFNASKFAQSVEVLLASAEIVKKIKDQDERIENINSDLKSVCENVARVYVVKSSCIAISVGIDDEMGRPRPDKGPQSLYAQASKAQQSGKRAFKRYDFVEALRCYDSAIKFEPKKMLYHLDKAEVYFAQGDLEKCKGECNEALSLAETGEKRLEARAFAQIGEVELRSCRPIEALFCFDKAQKLKYNPDVADKLSKLQTEFDRGCIEFMYKRNEVNGNAQVRTAPNPFQPLAQSFMAPPHLDLPLLAGAMGLEGLAALAHRAGLDEFEDDFDSVDSNDGYLDE